MTEDLKDRIRRVMIHGGLDACPPHDIELAPVVSPTLTFRCRKCARTVEIPWMPVFDGYGLEDITQAIRELAEETA